MHYSEGPLPHLASGDQQEAPINLKCPYISESYISLGQLSKGSVGETVDIKGIVQKSLIFLVMEPVYIVNNGTFPYESLGTFPFCVYTGPSLGLSDTPKAYLREGKL